MTRRRLIRFGGARRPPPWCGWPPGGRWARCWSEPGGDRRYFFGGGQIAAARIERLEGLEQWVRHLSDSMASGACRSRRSSGRRLCTAGIHGQVARLATRLSTPRLDRTEAVRRFADEIDDALGDIVVFALQRAVDTRGGERVPHVLQTLAEAVAAEVRARRAIEKDRAGRRQETQSIVVLLGVVIGGLGAVHQVRGGVRDGAGPGGADHPGSHRAARAVDDAAAVHRGTATEDPHRSTGGRVVNPILLGALVAGAVFGLRSGCW